MAVGRFRRGVQQKSLFFFKSGVRKSFPGAFLKTMTHKEALNILQLQGSSDLKEIKRRHKKMMIINHPDRGKLGSSG